MEDPSFHIPVLCREAVDLLITDAQGIYVDGTVGGGGHALEACSRLSGPGRLVCLDADEEALEAARARLARFAERTVFRHRNFRFLRAALEDLSVTRVNGVLLDLGVSSHQLDVPSRGFTFRDDQVLDMRMDRRQGTSARDLVNSLEERELADILWRLGEERFARRIARRIVMQRPVETTGALREAVASVVGQRFLTKSLARVFQALRIAVNQELESLQAVLHDAVGLLSPGGRIVVIAYHSLEDRIVKELFRAESTRPFVRGLPVRDDQGPAPRLRLLTRKPVTPPDAETAQNPRARSARLRAAERMDVRMDHA